MIEVLVHNKRPECSQQHKAVLCITRIESNRGVLEASTTLDMPNSSESKVDVWSSIGACDRALYAVQGGKRRFPMWIFGCLCVDTECVEFGGDDDHHNDLKSMKVDRAVCYSIDGNRGVLEA